MALKLIVRISRVLSQLFTSFPQLFLDRLVVFLRFLSIFNQSLIFLFLDIIKLIHLCQLTLGLPQRIFNLLHFFLLIF